MKARQPYIRIPKKILIGYDGKTDADMALEDLSFAGLPLKADVVVLTIAPAWTSTEFGFDLGYLNGSTILSPKDIRAFNEKSKSDAEILAGRARRRLEAWFPCWKIQNLAIVDSPAHGILAKAETEKPDLIVLGAHGHTAIGKLLMSSVSHKVFHHAHASVRINRAKVRSAKLLPRILWGKPLQQPIEKGIEHFQD